MPRRVRPESFEAAAEALAAAARAGERVRIAGAGTKQGWGIPGAEPDVELATAGLDRIVEHNAGDLTAVLEAGVPLARAQEAFAKAGQMLALDPWLGSEQQATIGGVLATGDSGPLHHRYGGPRDLALGMTVALSDGAIARSGGKVIKNVAGYDLAKLFCGAFGTLGLILSVNVRLHPLAPQTATVVGASSDPGVLAAAGRSRRSRSSSRRLTSRGARRAASCSHAALASRPKCVRNVWPIPCVAKASATSTCSRDTRQCGFASGGHSGRPISASCGWRQGRARWAR
jgi:FAD/FMN-containing dehydrogenase